MTSHRLHFVAWLVVFLAVVSNGQAESGTQKFVLPSKFPDFGIFHSADINNEGTTVAWCDRKKGREGGGGVLELGDSSDGSGSKLEKRCELMRFSTKKPLVFVVANHDFRGSSTNFIVGWNYKTKKREFFHGSGVFGTKALLVGYWKDNVFFHRVDTDYDLKAFDDDGEIHNVGLSKSKYFAISNGLALHDSENEYTLYRLNSDLSASSLAHYSPPLSPTGRYSVYTTLNIFSKNVALHPQLAVVNDQQRLINFESGGTFKETEFHQVRIEGDRFCALQGEELGKQKVVVGKVEGGQLNVQQTLFQEKYFSWPVGLACSENMKYIAILTGRKILIAAL